MASVRELLHDAQDLPGDSARRDAEILLGYCLDKPRSWLYTWPEREVPEAQACRYQGLLGERKNGAPIAYLTGSRDFWSLQLQVTPDTLIPRPETETLVEWALELSLPGKARVLDLGTGSGAIALALASERRGWRICASDVSRGALEVARANGRRCLPGRVEFIESDWYTGIAGRTFDLLVSNPPYIDPADTHLASGDLRFEPQSALVAADAGLADLAELVAGAPAQLQPGGWLLLEHGYDQGASVRGLLQAGAFVDVSTRLDMGGRERITGGRRRVD